MTATPMTPADGTDLWVVLSSQGEYSDRRESVVCVCADEATAHAYVEAAERRAREIEARMDELGLEWGIDWCDGRDDTEFRSALDPECGAGFCPGNPVTYYLSRAPLRLSVPTGRAEG